jgi:Xaa-Pro aminopeptidase
VKIKFFLCNLFFNYMVVFQLLWFNDYHAKVRETVGEEMLRQGLNDVYKWLLRKTEPILT